VQIDFAQVQICMQPDAIFFLQSGHPMQAGPTLLGMGARMHKAALF